ncbi:hypothetical protein [Tenggerimyces flavus]|uniref:DUF4926 domain-containing protein n=1 Tax=Tenggerimyces flavus TaxID=1708749 RepID=A0ABV7YAF5_9ACTN|nr:hypothetical protein [Tenggerimyces flavus]MBM7783627.1 hypothetical protein [Tenggerimyces flavus]
MKAKEYDRIRTLVEISSGLSGEPVPAGTEGTIVDVSAEGAAELYYADIEVGDSYDNIALRPEQFELV